MRIRGLDKLLDGRDWLWGKPGLALVSKAMLSKSLIQFSAYGGWGAVFPPCSFTWGQTMVGVMWLPSKGFMPACCSSQDCCSQSPDPMAGHYWPTPPLETPRHSQSSLAQSLLGSLLLSPKSWCAQGFVCALQESVSPVLWKFFNQVPLAFIVKFPGGSQSLCQLIVARILEWVPMPSSRGSSQPRDQTQVSCIVGNCFTVWAMKEVRQ